MTAKTGGGRVSFEEECATVGGGGKDELLWFGRFPEDVRAGFDKFPCDDGYRMIIKHNTASRRDG